jgi:hypothetical protein
VNCKTGGEEWNDIHIVVVSSASEKNPCRSVTAEMSPHYRPEMWTADNVDTLKGTKVRFTGPLFFDSSHQRCRAQSGGSFRKSVTGAHLRMGEIHPVYSLEVCEADSCSASSDAGWIPFEEYIGGFTERTEEP